MTINYAMENLRTSNNRQHGHHQPPVVSGQHAGRQPHGDHGQPAECGQRHVQQPAKFGPPGQHLPRGGHQLQHVTSRNIVVAGRCGQAGLDALLHAAAAFNIVNGNVVKAAKRTTGQVSIYHGIRNHADAHRFDVPLVTGQNGAIGNSGNGATRNAAVECKFGICHVKKALVSVTQKVRIQRKQNRVT